MGEDRDGCEMPGEGDGELVVCVNFGSNEEAHMASFGCGDFEFSDEVEYQIWRSGGVVTHWARVELPEE